MNGKEKLPPFDLCWGVCLTSCQQANQGAAEVLSEGSPARLAAYRTSNAEMLACFKKDMHKLETYLTVGRCRLSPEANCTL